MGSSLKITKAQAGYVHVKGTQYECRDCSAFLGAKERCVFQQPGAVIEPWGSCSYWMQGAHLSDDRAMGQLSKQSSGYVENEARTGYSCKRCESYGSYDCELVDHASPGPDGNVVHPDACCSLWTPDPERSRIPSMLFAIRKAK